jgi:hypothetical protein
MIPFLAALLLTPVPGSGVLADVSKDDVKNLLRIGTSEPGIRAYVESHRPVAELSGDDLRDLRAAGASDDLLVFLITPPQPPAAPPVTETYPYETPEYPYTYSYPPDDDYPYYSSPYAFSPGFTFVAPFHSHPFHHHGPFVHPLPRCGHPSMAQPQAPHGFQGGGGHGGHR